MVDPAERLWHPGAVVAARLRDGHVYSARLLEFPWVAFYDGWDDTPPQRPEVVTGRPVLRTLAVTADLLHEGWSVMGTSPLGNSLRPPELQFVQDHFNPRDLQMIGADQVMRPATFDEIRGLERAAVWAPEHIEDMLVAHARGEVDEHTLSLAPVKPPENRSTP
jgi:hypothetical protein